MNLILFSGKHASSRSIHLTSWRFALFLSTLFLIPALIGGGIMYWWVDARERLTQHHTTVLLQQKLNAQQAEVDAIRRTSLERIDALTPRLGELQARLLRLDALGRRLTVVADLGDEFDFEAPPPIGGPEFGGPESTDQHHLLYTDLELMNTLERLETQIEQRRQQLELIHSLLTNRNFADQVYLAGRPVEEGWMSSPFGRRSDPFTGRSSWHEGIDYAGRENSNVIAIGAGLVVFAAARGGFGNLVEIDHGDGYLTRYAHLNDFRVAKGDVVQRGDVVGLMGCTGRCTGTHVHFEVIHNGRAIDPARFVSRSAPSS